MQECMCGLYNTYIFFNLHVNILVVILVVIILQCREHEFGK